MVLKPAEQTPLSALALVVLAERAGVPPGVFNVVTGDAPAIGRVLTASPVVRKLSFTGSTAVGQLLMRDSAATLKKLSLELGGNAPFIVFDDADVDAAVAGALAAKYRNAGQTCVCSNRFFIQAGVYEAFTQKLAAAVAQLRVGNGMDEGVVQGPLIDQDALAKVQRGTRAPVTSAAPEGETLLILAGFAARLGHLDLPVVMAVGAFMGAFSDVLLFSLGRWRGKQVLARWPKLESYRNRLNAGLSRWGPGMIVGVRFMYGMRWAGPILVGMSSMPWPRFLLFNLIGAALWGFLAAGAGLRRAAC